MGIIYDINKDSWVEAREKSIIFGMANKICASVVGTGDSFEIDYDDLDTLEAMVQRAQEVRRDRKEKEGR